MTCCVKQFFGLSLKKSFTNESFKLRNFLPSSPLCLTVSAIWLTSCYKPVNLPRCDIIFECSLEVVKLLFKILMNFILYFNYINTSLLIFNLPMQIFKAVQCQVVCFSKLVLRAILKLVLTSLVIKSDAYLLCWFSYFKTLRLITERNFTSWWNEHGKIFLK
jgi:hypothetical protein